MPRLAELGVDPMSAPGLTPGLLGLVLAGLGLALLSRSAWTDAALPRRGRGRLGPARDHVRPLPRLRRRPARPGAVLARHRPLRRSLRAGVHLARRLARRALRGAAGAGDRRGRLDALPGGVPGAPAVRTGWRRLTALATAVAALAEPASLFAVFWATLLGMAVGMLPGLTATLGIALLTTLTFRMAAGDAILILICMYVGAIYGGSPHGDPAQHPRHAGQRRLEPRRLPAGARRARRRGDGPRHRGLVLRQHHRAAAAGADRAATRRSSACASSPTSSSGSRSSAS